MKLQFMNQHTRGITSTLKKDKSLVSTCLKEKNKKTYEPFSLQTVKPLFCRKQNQQVVTEVEVSKRLIVKEEQKRKLKEQVKAKTYLKNPSKQALKVSNKHLNQHFIQEDKRVTVQEQQKGKISETLNTLKKTKKQVPQKCMKQIQQNPKNQSVSTNYVQYYGRKEVEDSLKNRQKLKKENKILVENEYKQAKGQIPKNRRFPNSMRPKRSLSQTSGQSKNSYYGIVAEYRRKRLRSKDSIQSKTSKENSFSLTGSNHRGKKINRVKSSHQITDAKSLKSQDFSNTMQGFQPRLGSSVSSKESIKSSQSNLSLARNPFEEKVISMRQNLKLRKGNSNIAIDGLTIKYQDLKISQSQNYKKNENVAQKDESQEKKISQLDDKQLKKYKQLYKISLQKVKNVAKQLQVQKKKNELTKHIYKAEIDKLKRVKSFEGFQPKNYFQSKDSGTFLNEKPFNQKDSEYKDSKILTKGKNSENKLDNLKEKLKNNHLFSYQDYQGVTNFGAVNKQKHPSSLNKVNSNSILIPNEDVISQGNSSYHMIVEMSSEWRESGLFNSSFARSKLSRSREIENGQLNLQTSSNKRLPQNDKQPQVIKSREFTFKKLGNDEVDGIKENKELDIKDDSMFLDISSNLNDSKSYSNNQQSTSQQDLLNLLELDHIEENSKLGFRKKSPQIVRTVINQSDSHQPKRYQRILLQNQQPKRQKRSPKKIWLEKDFAEDMLVRKNHKNCESEYQSTESSTGMRSKNKIFKSNLFSYE